MSKRWRTSCLSVKSRWGPSEHRFCSGNGVRKDHALLLVKLRMRLTKAEKVSRPDRKFWKSEAGRAACDAAWAKAADKYDKAGTTTPTQTAHGEGAGVSVPDTDESDRALATLNQERSERFMSMYGTEHQSADGERSAEEPDAEAELWKSMRDGADQLRSRSDELLASLGYGPSESDTETASPVQDLSPSQRDAAEAGLRNAGLTATADGFRSEAACAVGRAS